MSASLPAIFPAHWAEEWFEDDYGLGMVLAVDGVRQTFRWIPPGRFLMGSPESEPERYEDEIQHPVVLSRGYWLADTACTQALWQAVMGDNPSTFRDDLLNPVENVSWDDVQGFIARLNERVSGLAARLPTEAEWEYACRAGTETAFSFGDTVTPGQVNYNGGYANVEGIQGLDRQKPVVVKSLPANPWGLYEMHGNVWEWCQDWRGAYANGEVVDPGGLPDGALRVLRGGSCFSSGRSARSAYRYGVVPRNRSDFIGFRLALGPGASGQTGGGEVAGRAVGAEPGSQDGRGDPADGLAAGRGPAGRMP